jgi:spermidine synthase
MGSVEVVETMARHASPRGEVVLRRRFGVGGADVDELIVNGAFAMDSSETFTEQQLADLALPGPVPRHRVLVGGLGLGYTAARVLGEDVDRLDVVEIEECLIEWAYAGVTPTLAAVAADPRTRLHAADIRSVLTGVRAEPAGPWEAIILDVDNGPDFLIHGANDALYAEPSLTAAYAQLAPGGICAIWCQGAVPELLAALRRVAPTADQHIFTRVRDGRRLDYAIYTMTRPGRPVPAR